MTSPEEFESAVQDPVIVKMATRILAAMTIENDDTAVDQLLTAAQEFAREHPHLNGVAEKLLEWYIEQNERQLTVLKLARKQLTGV